MINNLLVKRLLERLIDGYYTLVTSVIAFYPTIDRRTATVAAKTADYTVVQADLNAPTIFTNTGASGAIVLTLPAVASSKGKVVVAHALAAQTIEFLPQTGEAVNLDGSAVVTKYLLIAGVIGNFAELFCDGKQWVVTKANGVVTKQA